MAFTPRRKPPFTRSPRSKNPTSPRTSHTSGNSYNSYRGSSGGTTGSAKGDPSKDRPFKNDSRRDSRYKDNPQKDNRPRDGRYRDHSPRDGRGYAPNHGRHRDREGDPNNPDSFNVKEFLFLSKEPKRKKPKERVDEIQEFVELEDPEDKKYREAEEPAEDPVTNPVESPIAAELEPVLLKERSSWKKKVLGEDSLLHLLVLEILYAHQFSTDTTNANTTNTNRAGDTFSWLRENHSFFLKQEIPETLKNRVEIQVTGIDSNRETIVAEIAPFLVGWKWERLPPLRQLILITAWYFIKAASPDRVADRLNDAINHAKWFGDDKEYAFVNSILDKLITHHCLWPEKPVTEDN